MKYAQLLLLAVVLLSVQSCTLDKRHYRSGYYTNGLLHRADSQQRETSVEKEQGPAPQSQQVIVETTEAETAPPLVATGEKSEAESTPVSNESILPPQEAPHVHPAEIAPGPSPKIEPDKNQAIGAGIASAIFFLLGMTGLIIKGTSGSVGIFIGAAFVCFILCVILASFLYPREPKEKVPKEEKAPESKADRTIVKIGITLAIAAIIGVLAFGILIFGIFLNAIF